MTLAVRIWAGVLVGLGRSDAIDAPADGELLWLNFMAGP
ncbi:hypothetical protein MGSAQ_000859 [marine sediment metagenome]|uniref:Uncharacterized protein n=1 Tax=marine sediment metagenome TaxID=412755 RepID=A0A1B6NW20_9ZZZZ